MKPLLVVGTLENAGSGCQASFSIFNDTTGDRGSISGEVEEACSGFSFPYDPSHPSGSCWCAAVNRWSGRIYLQEGENVVRVRVDFDGLADEKTLRVILDKRLVYPFLQIADRAYPDPVGTPSAIPTVDGTSSDAAQVTWTNAATGATGAATGTSQWSADVPLAPCVENRITFVADNGYGLTYRSEHRVLSTFGITYPPDRSEVTTSVVYVFGCGRGAITWSNVTTGMTGSGSWSNGSWRAAVQLQPGPNAIEIALDIGGALERRMVEVLSRRSAVLYGLWPYGSEVQIHHARQLVVGRSDAAIRVTWHNAANGDGGQAVLRPDGSWGFTLLPVEGVNSLEVTAENALGSSSWRGSLVYERPSTSAVSSWGTLQPDVGPFPAAPDPEAAITAAIAVAAGRRHACAIRPDRRVVCWGANESGQLVDKVTDTVALALGDQHSCALTAGGAVWCWAAPGASGCPSRCGGVNTYEPQMVLGGTTAGGVPAFAAGGTTTCVGNYCWGEYSGYVAFYERPTSISVGGTGPSLRICGVMQDRTVKCTQSEFSSSAYTIPGLTDILAVARGSAHACALRADGKVLCWGSNTHGQLGDGTFTASQWTPVEVVGLSDAVEIAVGDRHSCALRVSGTVACWGNGWYGALGNASWLPEPSPVPVIGLDAATAIGAGPTSMLAVRP